VAVHQAARDTRVGALGLVAPGFSTGRTEVAAGSLRGIPVLAVAPEHDHLVSPADVERLVEHLGGGRVETLVGADHLLHGHAKDAARLIAGFLDRV
jgi:pimeloyl-ACP methyl ester carboxylesterase